jgi:hypothetical protein|tara:strand:+ start:2416 stop:2679 length:264 start_codon:yes stop_codon:yes gene_type:complete
MAYAAAGLHLIGGGSGCRMWVYRTADAIATVNTAAYFNDASNMLNIRDLIVVQDTNVPTTNFVTVLTNASGVVDISDGTAVVETDSD